MANSTDPFAQSVHGTDPQYLVEKITRLKVYNCDYWKSECFGLTSETIIDKAVALKYCGGTYGGNVKPTDFLALTLKMLQLQPEKDIVIAFIQNENFKYLRLLGALYMRLVGKPVDIYKYLEPLYNDYRKVAYRCSSGWSIKYIDQFIDSLLNDELVCDIALPHLPKRLKLEDLGILLPRKSALDIDINSYLLEIAASEAKTRTEEIKVSDGKNDNVAVTFDDEEDDDDDKSILDNNESLNKVLPVASESNVDSDNQKDDNQINIKNQHSGSEGESEQQRVRHHSTSRDRDNHHNHDYYSSRDKGSHQTRQSRDYSGSPVRDNHRSRDRNSSRDRDTRHSRNRDRENHRSREYNRNRDDEEHPRRYRSRSREISRDNHHRRSRDKKDLHTNRNHNVSRDRDGYSTRRSRSRDSVPRHNYQNRKESDEDQNSQKRRQKRLDENLIISTNENIIDEELNTKSSEERKINLDQKASKKFDKMFKKSSSASSTSVIASNKKDKNEKVEEFSVEYWNQRRESLGLKKLK